jgi:hypothetical protein
LFQFYNSMETPTEIKSYDFSTMKFSTLENIVNIKVVDNDQKFDDWFEIPYQVSEEETAFLSKLIQKHKTRMAFYMEEDLKAKYIIPILNMVDFMVAPVTDWYDSTLSGMVNGVEMKGFADFMVATGFDEAKKPYFFIQEFKPSVPDRNPEVQLLAELLVAIEKNNTNIMRGGYIIGRNWKFLILEKISENQFEYFVSNQFDSLDLAELKQIYVILQAVKHKYCQD